MGFAERAVEACLRAVHSGEVSERHVRDVLRSKSNGDAFVECLDSPEVMVRRLAVRIVGEKGPIEALVKAALVERDRSLLLEMLKLIGRSGRGVEQFEPMLSSKDTIVRDAVVEMFRRSGRPSFLFAMLFDDDDVVVQRIKRYMDEQGQGGEVSDSR